MVDWPVTLANLPLVGLSLKRRSAKVRSEMDVGPAIVRQRYTAAVQHYNVPMTFTNTQKVIFDEWYKDTLLEGTLSFLFAHPVSGDMLTMRFRSEDGPEFASVIGDASSDIKRWTTTLELEIIP